jgi:putative SOS response-associated peptidase YedK
MCGRYTLTLPLSNLVDAFDVPPPEFDFAPRYNIAPTQDVPVVAEDEAGRRMGLLRWGLVPFWADDPSIGNRLINARSETVARKPAFRGPFRRRRCLVPADGFYEWRKEAGGRKTPFWIRLAGQEVFTMAGIWDRWEGDDGEALHTFSILTTDAAPEIAAIHPRMPLVLPPSRRDTWLDPSSEPDDLLPLLEPERDMELAFHPVSTVVNSPGNDRPECIEPLDEG